MKLITLLVTTLLSISVFATTPETVAPQKPVEKGYIDFGLVPYHGQRTQILTLTNNAEEPLTNISLKISGDFYMKHNCPSTLQADESCRAKITFWATREGGHYGRLMVRTSAKDYLYDLYGYGDRDPLGNIPNPPIPNPPRP